MSFTSLQSTFPYIIRNDTHPGYENFNQNSRVQFFFNLSSSLPSPIFACGKKLCYSKPIKGWRGHRTGIFIEIVDYRSHNLFPISDCLCHSCLLSGTYAALKKENPASELEGMV